MNSEVDRFVKSSKQWRPEIEELRAILLTTKLEETFKWRLPCYALNDANIVIIQPFKACLGLMFFKGSLLKDPKAILVDNGPNSQSARRLEFHSVAEIKKLSSTIKAYVKEALAVEKSGKKVKPQKTVQKIPAELTEAFSKKPKLKRSFEALTPGRQRAYLIHFSGAKHSETRKSRIEKCTPRILEGRGINDPA